MPIINSYPQDVDIQDQDAWIGTDYTTKGTKQYTAEAVANYLNQKGKVSIAGQVSYKFVNTPFAGQGTMALSPNNGSSFSAITGFKIAKADLSGQGIQEYLDYLIGREIIIVNQNDPNSFGHYSIYTYTVDGDNDQYYDLVVTFLGGNGSITVNSFYSLANFTFGGAASTIATLTNIGIGNVNPSTYPTLKGLTVSYNNGTATIGLNIQDLPNTTIPTSASDILVPWAAEVSGVTYNSKATLQDLIDDTGVVGGPYLPLTGGTLTGDLYVDTKVGIGTASPDSLLEISTTDATKDFIKLTSGGGGVNPSLIFEKSAAEQGVVQYIRNGDLKIYNTDNDGGVMLSGSGATNYDMYINNSGNVGIGTTSPAAKLDVKSSSNDSIPFQVTNSLDTDAIFSILEDGGGDGRARIFNSAGTLNVNLDSSGNSYLNGGNVGIGTTNPSAKLEVQADVTANVDVVHFSNSNSVAKAKISLSANSSGELSLIDGNNNTDVFITSNGGSYFNGGNIGIGTTSPSEKLEVAGSVRIGNMKFEPTNAGRIGFNRNTTNGVIYNSNYPAHQINAASSTNDFFEIQSYNTAGVFQGSVAINAGKVGIGTTSPTRKLSVESSSSSIVADFKYSAAGYSSIDLSNNASFARLSSVNSDLLLSPAGSEKMRITSSGNVGIGTTNPHTKLTIDDSNTAGISQFGIGDVSSYYLAIGHNSSGNTDGFIGTVYNNNSARFDIRMKGTAQSDAKVTVLGSGNVGIGTTTPYYPFVAKRTGSNVVASFESDQNAYLRIARTGTQSGEAQLRVTNNGSLSITSDGNIGLKTGGVSGTNRLYVRNSDGNVGIGTTSPTDLLTVVGNARVTGTLKVADGTYNAPSIAHRADEDTGIYFPSNDVIGISTNALERVRINSSGNVGIGTTNPDYKLDVEGDVSLVGGGENYAIMSPINQGMQIAVGDPADVAVPLVTFNGDQKVGIGTTSPSEKLEVVGDIKATNKIFVEDSLNSRLEFASSISNQARISAHKTNINQPLPLLIQAEGIKFGTVGGGEKMRIDSSGNVGIGTTSPSNRLDVVGTASVSYLRVGSSASQEGIIRYYSAGGQGIGITTGALNSSGIGLYVSHGSNNRNVGIGTTNPSEKLEVVGNVKVDKGSVPGKTAYLSDDGLYIGRPSAYGGGYPSNVIVDPSSPNYLDINSRSRINLKLNNNTVLVANDSGNVGIGTTTPGRKLQVEGGDFYTNDKSDTTGASVGYGGNSFQIRNGNTSEDLNFDIFNRTASAWSTPLIIKNTGNVGIGTTTPSSKLEVNGEIDVSGDGYYMNGYAWAYMDPSATVLTLGDWDGNEFPTRIMDNNSSEVLRVTDGNVGIGTTSPASKLEVDGGDIEVDDSASGLILKSPDGTRYRITVANGGTLTVTAV